MKTDETEIIADSKYGPLQKGFSFELRDGYTVLTGKNNSGKSAILQLIFSKLVNNMHGFGPGKVCLILPDRLHIGRTGESGGASITGYNSKLAQNLAGDILHYEDAQTERSQLARLLLHQNNFTAQAGKLNQLLGRLGFPELVFKERLDITFEDILVTVQGSGLRTALPILTALTNPMMEVVLIDEPELFLEPKVQKVLRDLLQESGKKVIVATHSHLFLNRKENQIGSNYTVSKEEGNVLIEKVNSNSELFEVVFGLLGSSPNDLFFPNNFLVVEGASDQEILNKVLELKGIEKSKVFVVSAEGLSKVKDKVKAFSEYLRPYILEGSIYNDRVVALVDLPNNDGAKKQVRDLEKHLSDGGRLFLLDSPSIEEYLHEDFYTRIEKNKNEEIQRIKGADDYGSEKLLKTELSKALAEKLEVADLDKIPEIVKAVDKAAENI